LEAKTKTKPALIIVFMKTTEERLNILENTSTANQLRILALEKDITEVHKARESSESRMDKRMETFESLHYEIEIIKTETARLKSNMAKASEAFKTISARLDEYEKRLDNGNDKKNKKPKLYFWLLNKFK
jgi:chromosome segregation ATPase